MFCPRCHAEYREGFTECADCRVALVAVLPEAPEGDPNMKLETVFDSTNPALIGIAKTVLEGAGIEFVTVGENAGAVFSGNPFLGRVRIQVEKSRVAEATSLLSEIAEHEAPLGTDDEPAS